MSSRRPIWLHSWHFHHKPRNQGTRGRCVRSEKQQISPEMLIYMVSENYTILTKEGSISFTLYPNCKHSLSFKNIHKQPVWFNFSRLPSGSPTTLHSDSSCPRARGSHLYVLCKEFATGSKFESSDQSQSRDQGSLQTAKIKGSRCTATI